MNKLAIVIPAYKPDFLDKALQSIDKQIDKNFQVYIGNDGSPHSLWEIAKPYVEKNGWIYRHFEENLGGKNLVNHWNRCVKLSHEPWVWLFSDDDEMDPNCVAGFFNQLSKGSSQVFKFNFSIIDKESKILETNPIEDRNLSGFEFGKLRFERKTLTSAVEFIFSRAAFDRESGFVNFPAAWCSDDASWIAFSEPGQIEIINRGMVFWRLSAVNISSQAGPYIEAKTKAAIHFIQWFNNRYATKITPTLFGEQVIWFRLQLEHLHFKVPFSMAVAFTFKLKPTGIYSWLRTFNEIFARSHSSMKKNKGLKPNFFRELIAGWLPKF